MRGLFAVFASIFVALGTASAIERNAYFGDTHVHTNLSFDAHIFGNRNGPHEANLYAKGETLQHPGGFAMKLKRPLDFLAVTDHAIYLGMLPAMNDPESSVGDHPISRKMQEADSISDRMRAFRDMFPRLGRPAEGVEMPEDDLLDLDVVRSAWTEIVETANRHNEPGRFTSFIGFEYTTGPEFRNLHRNVIFADSRAPNRPFSRGDSDNPEELWSWMDELRKRGIESLAIPHNSNGSDGAMFANVDFRGNPITPAYTRKRMRNEPLVEISQVKGTSETHPLLSPNDEWADFEIMNYRIATWLNSRPEGSYVRDALLRGLQMKEEGKGNPFQFGIISASDTHVGAGAFDEKDYWSKVGFIDATGKLRGSVRLNLWERTMAALRTYYIAWSAPDDAPDTGQAPEPFGEYLSTYFADWGASGLAGVWAERNTRSSIYAGMRRKETFGTSGPRMKVRLFAGYGYDRDIVNRAYMAEQGYNRGVPMGGTLRGQGSSPQFIVWASRDAMSAPLQRLQIVKGWRAGGRSYEKVYDVACADGRAPVKDRCRDYDTKVDLATCDYSASKGAAELKTLWRDPNYRVGQDAFYYVRVLENPTCRWSTWDAIRADSPPNPKLATTIQERAWGSPIWIAF